MMHAGAAAVVACFLLFLPAAPALEFAAMRAASLSSGMRTAVFVLAMIGFGAKAGLIPLHLWLPRAHPMAPTPISALMSGVMLKTAVYGFVRVVFDILGGGPAWWGYVALIAGAVSGLLGILYALAERDLKRLLAYSSVENIGIIFLGLGAALIFMAHGSASWAALALMGALLHTMNHGLFKSALFLGAGAIRHSTHTLDLEGLGGLQKRMPWTGTAFLVACCSIVGLPLFNGFVSEWLTFRSFVAGAALTNVTAMVVLPLMAGVLALIGGLAAACFAKVYGVAFLGRPRSAGAEHASEVPFLMHAAIGALALCCVAAGVMPGFILQPLSAAIAGALHGAAVPAGTEALATTMPWIALTLFSALLAVTAVRGAVRVTATWACGMPGFDHRMQYTSTAFSKPLRKVFSEAYKAERTVEVSPTNETYFPISMTYRSVRTTSYERTLYRPAVDAIVAGAHRLRQLQTGNIQIYLLYIFLALIALLVGMRFA
jgi:hydrogenase-4 component B